MDGSESLNCVLANNKMQRTSRGSNGGSPLILVFYAPRQGRARDTCVTSTPTHLDLNLRRHGRTLVSLSSRSGLALTPCPTRRVTALAARAKRRATPPLSPKPLTLPAARLALEHHGRGVA
jgi:hypothetical protein